MTTTAIDTREGLEDNERVLRLRIVNVDHYVTEPHIGFDDNYSTFRANEIRRVPIIRVFGITDKGVKTCLHVHRYYPYLSVRYVAKKDDNYEYEKKKFMNELVQQLESRLVPNKRRTRNNSYESALDQLIYDIQEVDAIPFYGFHDKYEKFLRIYFYNPLTVQKVNDLLLSGEIMDRQIQPFEAHIPFTLQFLIDNNLYGMNFLDAIRVEYRKTDGLDTNLMVSHIEPMSSCQWECDVFYENILNRQIVSTDRRLPGLEAIWAEELKRCHNSQEILNLKGIASQDRNDIPLSTRLESFYMKKLFEGLSKLNIRTDPELNVNSSQLSPPIGNESDFAEMMVQFIGNEDSSSDQISQTIEEVINSSQTLSINQTIEDVIINSQNHKISQTIEDVIIESQKQNKSRAKPKRNTSGSQSRRRLNFNKSLEESDNESQKSLDEVSDNDCQPSVSNESVGQPSPLYADAGTQTESKDSFDESIGSMFGLNEGIDEIVCDCDSDECCDQCCDQGSDQCECDCERCEFEKCKRIPQFDGAFDSDDSGSNFSLDYKDRDDSDFEVSVGSKRKRTDKKTPSRGKGRRTSPSKRAKTSTAVSDDSDIEEIGSYRHQSSSRRTATRKRSPSAEVEEDFFQSSSCRKVKSSKNLSDTLWEKFKPKDAKKKTNDGSPIHASFSESDGEGKGSSGPLAFLSGLKDFSYSPKKSLKKGDDNRSERSLTPYLSEVEEELPPKTKPGPRSSKASDAPKPVPKSSKASTSSSPGPKSSKAKPKPKAGPKSSKRDDSVTILSDTETIDLYTSSRSRRSTIQDVNYDDTIERTTSIYSDTKRSKGPKKAPQLAVRSGGRRKSMKSEVESGIDSISPFISSPIDDSYERDDDFYEPNPYSSISELTWKSFGEDLVQIDSNYYDMKLIDTIGRESLDCNPTPDYILFAYKLRFENNIDYWKGVEEEVQKEIITGRKAKSGTRSKGALKDFYTLPHFNVKKSPPKQDKTQNKAKKANTNQNREFAALMADASHILKKRPAVGGSKKGVIQSKPKSKKGGTPATKSVPKRGNSSGGKSSAGKRSAESSSRKSSRSRVQRGVTSSTLFHSISIPFYESDIINVTDLTGAKKKAYLKAMCHDFELECEKVPKHYINSYRNHNISPFLFDNIYYNDYSGYLPNEESRETQDVLIVVKSLINDVVSITQCVNRCVEDICSDYEPKPAVDVIDEDSADVEEHEEWNYEEEGVIGVAVDSGIAVTAYGSNYDEGYGEESELIAAVGADDPLSQVLMKTFGSDNDEEEDICQQNGEQNKDNDENEEQNDNNEDNTDQNDGQSDREEQEESNDFEGQQNFNDCSVVTDEGVGQSYAMSAQCYSPVAQSDQYSNQSNGHYMESNGAEYQQQNQYEEQEESTDTSHGSASNQMMEQPVEQSFKMPTDFTPEMYSFGVNTTPNQNVVYQQNPLQNPIVPTLMPPNTHPGICPQQNIFSPQQNWAPQPSIGLPLPQYSSMPTLKSVEGPTPPDNEFDVTNYNYMPFYSNNSNIPQFDGIFDDDDIQTVGKPFNMRCTSDETIEQLSQGSRSEEASPKKHAADAVVEALRAGTSGGTSSGQTQKTTTGLERYCYYIDGVVVKIPKSLPKQCLQQLGREYIPLEPLTTVQSHYRQESATEFTSIDCKSFFKTRLTGAAKLNYLQSLCNKNIRISLKRLNLSEIQNNSNINSKNNSFISVSSLLKYNKKFVSLNNNKRLCVETNDSKLLSVKKDSKSNASTSAVRLPNDDDIEIEEIPESPLNDISRCDDMSDEIYSFYSDNTLSPDFSQSTVQSSQVSNQSFNEIPESGSSDVKHKQHSTPMNSQKFKPFSQTLSETQKALELSARDSPNSSSKLFSDLSQNISSEEPFVENRPKGYVRYDSLIEGPTPSTTFDYAFSSVDDSPVDSDYEYQYLTTMSVEIHVSTRAKLYPDPQTDAIEVLFYSIHCDRPPDSSQRGKYITGLIAIESEIQRYDCSESFNVIHEKRFRPPVHSVGNIKGVVVDFADDEICLLTKFVEIVQNYDPDIIAGYKVDTLSWGYIMERANVLNMSILTPLSRINDEKFSWNVKSAQNVKCQLTGRITLNLWSIMRSELTLNQYNYENCHFHVLHERIPNFGFEKLTQLYANRFDSLNRRRVIHYYLRRTVGSLRLLDKLDFIGKTSELARLFGIQFHEVFNRGTQFRVESIMLRFARLQHYIPISPSPRQVASQNAPEILPLILEPESKYYTDPVVVLDFQSLYPSMMIAYNYCYSTCLGKVDQLLRETDFINFGCFELEINKQPLLKYQNDIHISPNGVVFLKSNVRKGILPKMLEEILETRVMVKKAMKSNNKKQFPNKGLNRKLDARQLGLKMIANFTYGYTSANFSGRMPCVDIADSIVAKGRETLERAINLVHSRPEWGAKVIYGDTDSLFIHFPGLSKEEAFRRGHDIAEAVTQQNPKPVRLKFEKVYLPCVLETKKRYVGFIYESPEQQIPIFDAKGIETVRRDSCPAVAKMLEKSLRILFSTNDLNGVKNYLMRQFQKILNGRISILEDFVFAREYRGADSYSDKSHVPSAEIAKRRTAVDPKNEPKIKERVPYVVIAGAPNEQLFKLVKEPLDLIKDPSLRLNSQYYIEKAIIPALNRVFQLMGQNVNDWYREMPKKLHYQRYQYLLGRESKTGRRTIPQFFNTTQCCVCGTNCMGNDFCDACRQNKDVAIASVADQIRDIQLKYSSVVNSCMRCSASTQRDIDCQSIECPNLFRYHQSKLDLMNANYLSDVINKYF